MNYSASALFLSFFAALSAAAPTPNTDCSDPSQVVITGFTYRGTGCPAGSAAVRFFPDFETLTIIFNDHEVTVGPGSQFSDHFRNCNLNVQISYPAGCQYTLYKADYTGYARLDKGVTAKQLSSYWFAGFISPKPTFQSTWHGPYSNQYSFTPTVASTLYSPCGVSSTLVINTQLVLTRSNPDSYGHFDTKPNLNAKNQHAYGVNWRKCP